jgi:hypothetical protein
VIHCIEAGKYFKFPCWREEKRLGGRLLVLYRVVDDVFDCIAGVKERDQVVVIIKKLWPWYFRWLLGSSLA